MSKFRLSDQEFHAALSHLDSVDYWLRIKDDGRCREILDELYRIVREHDSKAFSAEALRSVDVLAHQISDHIAETYSSEYAVARPLRAFIYLILGLTMSDDPERPLY